MKSCPSENAHGSSPEFSDHLEETPFQLPKELSRDYQVLSCLKYSDQTAAYLLKQKASGKTVLLKTTADLILAKVLINEKYILEIIHQQQGRIADSFPVSLGMLKIQDTHYYIRTYIEGKTLEDLCESNLRRPGLPADLALNYMIQLTELLHFLHNLNPPVIHRDIKPQNVVVDHSGNCHFIDLGISRLFGNTKKNDTFIMGTRSTAPPEQFGYQQTDIRSDLYSLGILLFYCITGEYEVSDSVLAELELPVQQIIRKATMFDPAKRYQSAEELMPDLLAARYSGMLPDGSSKKVSRFRGRFFTGLLLILNLGLCGVLAIQQRKASISQEGISVSQEKDKAPGSVSEAYTFTEPLIEEAVRAILNKPEGTITTRDLEKITGLHIMGLQIYSDDSEIWFKGNYPWFYDDATRETGLYLQTGTIRSLEDITHMPNLNTLSLYKQQISDISLLEGTEIQNLGLGYNPLTDLTPLDGNTTVRSLNLAGLDISGTETLSTLTQLQSLNISATALSSLKGLENCSLEYLNLVNMELNDYREIQTLSCLCSLELSYLNQEVLDSISGMALTELNAYYSSGLDLDCLSVLPDLEILLCNGDSETETIVDNPNLPNLKSLDLIRTRIKDFTGMSSLTSLTTLYIYDLECDSYEGLDQIPNLKYIICTDEQQKTIKTLYPDSSFLFRL